MCVLKGVKRHADTNTYTHAHTHTDANTSKLCVL
jgi:hypothetical protein